MIVKEHRLGVWVKDGKRYRIRPEEGQMMHEIRQYALDEGYVRDPLPEEERQAILEHLRRIPERVSPRQLRLALIEQGTMPDQITSAIEAIPDETMKQKALIEWEYATFYERNNPTVSAIGSMIGLDEDGIDNLFIEADKI